MTLSDVDRRVVPIRESRCARMAIMHQQRGKLPGPPRWWDSKQTPLRLPVEHHALYVEAARAYGLSLNAYLVWQLAKAHELEIPAALQTELEAGDRAKEQPQDELPLAASGY